MPRVLLQLPSGLDDRVGNFFRSAGTIVDLVNGGSVVDRDILGDLEDEGGEVENAGDAGLDEGVGDFLGGSAGEEAWPA